jgi:hypothetical protein
MGNRRQKGRWGDREMGGGKDYLYKGIKWDVETSSA